MKRTPLLSVLALLAASTLAAAPATAQAVVRRRTPNMPPVAAPGVPQRVVPPSSQNTSLFTWRPTTGQGANGQGGGSLARTYGGPGMNIRVAPLSSAPMRLPLPNLGGLHVLTLTMTGSGREESFLLQVPNLGYGATQDVPLVVGFHSFSVSPYDITGNTAFDQECDLRGWYLLAPMSGWQRNLASTPAQINTNAVIDFVTSIYNIDLDRIYAVGFSMGAGTALNYAARYTDLREPRFAAIANHTGLLAQEHSYNHLPPCNPLDPMCGYWIYHTRYGGSPATVPFEYARASLAPIPYVSGFPNIPAVDTTEDFARNLLDIPIRSTVAEFDPLGELLVQNYAFEAYMASLGADHVLTVVPSVFTHSWSTLDAVATCNWFATQTRTNPTSGDFHADRDGRWYYFDVVQDAPGSFTRVAWDFDAQSAELTIWGTENLNTLEVDASLLGLSTLADFSIRLQPGDGTSDVVIVKNVPVLPATVLRDGVVTGNWTWDGQANELTIHEASGAALHTWDVEL